MIQRSILLSLLFFIHHSLLADTINNYMNIVGRIPKMEVQADPNAQTWARSARNVLTITNESIAETMMEANTLASKQGRPLFCLPKTTTLDANTLKNLIEQIYPTLQGKETLTVSDVAWIAVQKQYPCHPQHAVEAGISAPWIKHEEVG